MTTPETLMALREDLAYHQARVLLLVTSVAAEPGHQGKVDGLTKLAKLDFLVRYPDVAPDVLDALQPDDPSLHVRDRPTHVVDPMIRYKYGPWDDRYYPVIGALVGRGLLKYSRGRRGNVALKPTDAGIALAAELAQTRRWVEVRDRCDAIARASAGLTGSALKRLIYARLPELMNRPHRETII